MDLLIESLKEHSLYQLILWAILTIHFFIKFLIEECNGEISLFSIIPFFMILPMAWLASFYILMFITILNPTILKPLFFNNPFF